MATRSGGQTISVSSRKRGTQIRLRLVAGLPQQHLVRLAGRLCLVQAGGGRLALRLAKPRARCQRRRSIRVAALAAVEVAPYSIDRQDGGAGVALSGDLEELVECLGACAFAEADLVRHASSLERSGGMLGQAASDRARTSPTTSARARRFGFRQDVSVSALANRSAAWWNRRSPGSSSIKRKCFFVLPWVLCAR